MSRKGQLWRGELAERIEEHLAGTLSADDLVDWAMDHPFFDDRTDLDDDDQHALGNALGHILQIDDPTTVPTTPDQWAAVVKMLWRSRPLPDA